jgi:hypothetical protein
VRCLGYAFAVVSAALFGLAFVYAVGAAFNADHLGVTIWMVGAAMLCVAFVLVATRYVMRRAYSGGYFLVALACLVATFACVLSWFPLLALQD